MTEPVLAPLYDGDTLPRRQSLRPKASAFRRDVLGQSRLETKPSADSCNAAVWSIATRIRKSLSCGRSMEVYGDRETFIQLVGVLSTSFSERYRLEYDDRITIKVRRIK